MAKNLSVKVSEKGAISICGLRRFPITLYRDELEAVLDKSEALRKFIKENQRTLATKSEGEVRVKGATSL